MTDFVKMAGAKGRLVLAYAYPHSFYGVLAEDPQSTNGSFLCQFQRPYLVTDVLPNQTFVTDPSWSFESVQKFNERAELALYGRMEPGEVVCLAKEFVVEPKVKLCGEWTAPRRA